MARLLSLVTSALLLAAAQAIHVVRSGTGNWIPAINENFPDPCLVKANNKWYAFATAGHGFHIQIASTSGSDAFGTWTRLNKDALPANGWTTGRNFWAPDVVQADDGSWVMSFSGEFPGRKHCIGIARSPNIEGPYIMDANPIHCGHDLGGSIDSSVYLRNGQKYLVWKVDGVVIGVDPTPLIAQPVNGNYTGLLDSPTTLLQRNGDEGGLIEAPDVVTTRTGGVAVFYSSHYYNEDAYDVRYATADALTGPWERRGQLLKTGSGLKGPGGWQSAKTDMIGVFHSWCRTDVRCMYITRYAWD